jgi:dUTP pyrophosphatase
MILNNKMILEHIKNIDMITGYIDLETQLQPNGFDLTIDEISELVHGSLSRLDFDNKNRSIPDTNKIRWLETTDGEVIYLDEGVYKFKVNETIKLPENIMAISIQRSSLMRMLCDTNIGLWDCGYHGSGYSILKVHNPDGITVYRNARIIQVIFMRASTPTDVYKGIYQHENV